MSHQNTKTNKAKEANKAAVVAKLKDLPLLGEIITWGLNGASHPHAKIVESLRDAQLHESAAKEMLPRHAFARAAKRLSEERVIDLVKEDGDWLVFQFTGKTLSGDEWKFSKETTLRVNKTTGEVVCPIANIQALAKSELDRCIENRTTNDITKIIQRLFEMESELFPIRDQGGCYFVPVSQTHFVDKVSKFVVGLGGRLSRFPVPEGTVNGNAAVGETVSSAMQTIIREHETAIEGFTLNTRNDTLETAADKIKMTRFKIEAYANFLEERREELLASLEAAQEKLTAKIESIAAKRAESPLTTTADGGTRAFIMGHSVVSVMRWMGKQGWTFKQIKAVVAEILGAGVVSDFTVRAQGLAGRKGERGAPANLTDKQIEELNAIRAKVGGAAPTTEETADEAPEETADEAPEESADEAPAPKAKTGKTNKQKRKEAKARRAAQAANA